MPKLAELIGQRLREVRKEKGLRQEDMEKYGVNYKYYQRVENGKVNLTLATIEKLARALEIEPADLFTLPLSKSKEVDELILLLREIIQKNDMQAVRKLNIFIRDILS